jgi:hypothetical protein
MPTWISKSRDPLGELGKGLASVEAVKAGQRSHETGVVVAGHLVMHVIVYAVHVAVV